MSLALIESTPGLQIKRDSNFSNLTLNCDPRLILPNTEANKTSGILKPSISGKLAAAVDICDLDVSNLSVNGELTVNTINSLPYPPPSGSASTVTIAEATTSTAYYPTFVTGTGASLPLLIDSANPPFSVNPISGALNLAKTLKIVDSSTAQVAIGYEAGLITQSSGSVAIGNISGKNNQGANCVTIGNTSGQFGGNSNVVAIGSSAGAGTSAGVGIQGADSVAIGTNAGKFTQGADSIAVRKQAGTTKQKEDTKDGGTSERR